MPIENWIPSQIEMENIIVLFGLLHLGDSN